jgi:hypothetical protein
LTLADQINKNLRIPSKDHWEHLPGVNTREDLQNRWDKQAWGDELTETNKEHIKDTTQLPGEWREVTVICPHCTSDNFVYIYDDEKTCYCCQCDQEFDVADMDGVLISDAEALSEELKEMNRESLNDLVSDDPATVSQMADRIVGGNDDFKGTCKECDGRNGCHFSTCKLGAIRRQLKAYEPKGGTNTYTGSYGTNNSCTHRPQHIIAGEGWGVWAGKKIDCQSYANDYDVVLNLTFTSIKEPHIIPIPELEEFEEMNCQFKEIQLDWPDYSVIRMPREFWAKLLKYLEDNKLRMLVFCTGGHGRTGTALAVMMTMVLNYTPKQAIEWVRKNYCDEAIETTMQEFYIEQMAKVPLAEAAVAGKE